MFSVVDDMFKEQERRRHMTFHGFCESWFAKMDANLVEFDTVYRRYEEENSCQSSWTGGLAPRTTTIKRLEDRMILHYSNFEPKMIPPEVASGLDGSLTWAGAWSPSRALIIGYSKLAVRAQLKSRLEKIILKALVMSDLDCLAESQQWKLDALKIETAREEDDITDILKAVNESVEDGKGEMRLFRAQKMADELRMTTLRRLDDILTLEQLEIFLSSAWEVKLGIRKWMKIWDVNDIPLENDGLGRKIRDSKVDEHLGC